jgi:hypothetical protein
LLLRGAVVHCQPGNAPAQDAHGRPINRLIDRLARLGARSSARTLAGRHKLTPPTEHRETHYYSKNHLFGQTLASA